MSIRFLFFIISLFIASNPVVGGEREKAEMDAIAASVLKEPSTRTATGDEGLLMDLDISLQLNRLLKESDGNCDTGPFAVYTYKKGAPGYVIVTTDDSLPSVVAFSEKEYFQLGRISSAMQILLKQYNAEFAQINRYLTKRMTKGRSSAEVGPEVAPLLGDIAFSQFSPYNDRCPMYNGERTVTGCLATAMAQIMAYYRYPMVMSGEDIDYVAEKYSIPVSWNCSTTKFDWDNILNTYSAELVSDYTDQLQSTTQQYMTFTAMKPSNEHDHCIDINHLVSFAVNMNRH